MQSLTNSTNSSHLESQSRPGSSCEEMSSTPARSQEETASFSFSSAKRNSFWLL